MRRSTFVSWFALLTLGIAASASAGYVSAPGVTFTEPYGQYDGRMTGSMIGARNAPNNLEYIRCTRSMCWMRNAAGATRSCWVINPDDLPKFDAIGPASYFEITWHDSGWLGGVCDSVTITNGSQYLP